MTASVDELIRSGWEALEASDASAARREFEAALEHGELAEAVEGLGRVAYLECDYRAAAALHERAYALYRKEDDPVRAARAARVVAWISGSAFGDWAVQSGWFARAKTLLEEAGPDGPERGWVLIIQTFTEPDLAVREEILREAISIGRRHRDPDVEFLALAYLAAVYQFTSREHEGMVLLDEVLAAVCAGEVTDLCVMEATFCGFFTSCELLHDIDRADQWIRAADGFIKRRNVVAAFCRAHYGGLLTAAGRWTEAETELAEAARRFESGLHGMRANALIRLADLRLRQGRIDEAGQLLTGLDHHPDAVRALATLYMARGATARARDLLERALESPEVEQHIPGGPTAGPLLAQLVDVLLAETSIVQAAEAAERLGRIASGQRSDYLTAVAALAKGRVCMARGTGDARAYIHEALSGFARAQMPLELARARLELAKAVSTENPEVAVAEAKAALQTFEELEAARDADAATAVLRTLGVQARTGAKGAGSLTKREQEVLDLVGEGLSNPEIADRLYLSPKTVGHHVGSILSKLGLRSRAEAAAYTARREGQSRAGE